VLCELCLPRNFSFKEIRLQRLQKTFLSSTPDRVPFIVVTYITAEHCQQKASKQACFAVSFASEKRKLMKCFSSLFVRSHFRCVKNVCVCVCVLKNISKIEKENARENFKATARIEKS